MRKHGCTGTESIHAIFKGFAFKHTEINAHKNTNEIVENLKTKHYGCSFGENRWF